MCCPLETSKISQFPRNERENRANASSPSFEKRKRPFESTGEEARAELSARPDTTDSDRRRVKPKHPLPALPLSLLVEAKLVRSLGKFATFPLVLGGGRPLRGPTQASPAILLHRSPGRETLARDTAAERFWETLSV